MVIETTETMSTDGVELNKETANATEEAPKVEETSQTSELEESFYGDNKEAKSKENSTEEKTEDKELEEPTGESKKETEPKEEKSEEEKKDDSEKEEEYSLKLSEETVLGETHLKDIEAFAKENKISGELAQKILAKQEDTISELINSENTRAAQELEDWRSQVVNDEHIGGSKLTETSTNAKKAVSAFGSEGFVEILKATGYGDHPEVVRFLSRIGSLMGNDEFIPGDGGFQKKEKTIEDHFYGAS